MNQQELAQSILEKVGGVENVVNCVHCATRLRFKLNDIGKVDIDGIKALEKVLMVVEAQGLCQIVLGNHVIPTYKELQKLIPKENTVKKEGNTVETVIQNTDTSKSSLVNRLMNTLSGIFSPYVGLLAATGILKSLLTIATSFSILDGTEPFYLVMSGAGNAMFYFFPILLAFSASKQFNANPYIGAVIAAALLEPNIMNIGEVGTSVSFLGIPMIVYGFASTVFPIILTIYVYSLLEKWLQKTLPDLVKFAFTPLICIVVMIPLTLLVIGPVGVVFSTWIANSYGLINSWSPVLANSIMAGSFVFLVLFGIHIGLFPIMINNFAVTGTDTLIGALGLANYAMLGVMVAFMIQSKNRTDKGTASAAALSLFLCGVSEPALYGICIRYRRTFISIVTSALIGGALYGLFGCYAINFGFTGILGLAVFYTPKFGLYLVSVGVTILAAMIFTFILGTDEKSKKSVFYNNSKLNTIFSKRTR
jgi:PTS system beta-glucosides-specific IIC component